MDFFRHNQCSRYRSAQRGSTLIVKIPNLPLVDVFLKDFTTVTRTHPMAELDSQHSRSPIDFMLGHGSVPPGSKQKNNRDD